MNNAAWEPVPDEGSEAFFAFCIYRDIGLGRSIDKVALSLNPEREYKEGKRVAWGRLFEWSSRYHWVARARDYDLEVARIEREEWERERREMARKRLRVSHRMLDMVAQRLDSVQPGDIHINQLPRWAESSAKVSVTIDENPYDLLLKGQGGDRTEDMALIMSDDKARQLALDLEERLWGLKHN